MPKFRKKPVVIEAMQFPGLGTANIDALVAFDDWVERNQGDRKCRYVGGVLVIPTLEGDHNARAGDWIIKGVAGELYPCRADIFEKTYEKTYEPADYPRG